MRHARPAIAIHVACCDPRSKVVLARPQVKDLERPGKNAKVRGNVEDAAVDHASDRPDAAPERSGTVTPYVIEIAHRSSEALVPRIARFVLRFAGARR